LRALPREEARGARAANKATQSPRVATPHTPWPRLQTLHATS
jgi:hypothetical protein